MVTTKQKPGEINIVFFKSRRNRHFNVMSRISQGLFRKRTLFRALRAGTHYPHVTWAHVILRAQLGC